MNTTILQLVAIYKIQLHVSATFTNPTIYDVRGDLVPLPKLPHILYSHLVSSLDNRMMAYIQGRNM